MASGLPKREEHQAPAVDPAHDGMAECLGRFERRCGNIVKVDLVKVRPAGIVAAPLALPALFRALQRLNALPETSRLSL
jgi:hypothetical protein